MARITIIDKVDPCAWLTSGKWTAHPRGAAHGYESECDRALWFSLHWATKGAAPPRDLGQLPSLQTVARMATPPAPIDGLWAETVCQHCPHLAVCLDPSAMAKGCRTCSHVAADGKWFCNHFKDDVAEDLQRVGCDHWEGIGT